MSPVIPTQARVVVVGGGIAGASTAYHLAKLGVRDVVLLEQGRLTCGTTWHAAGLVGQTRATRNATRMSRYGIDLYASLEQETGLATGWKACGSLNVAKTKDRLTLMKRQMARAKSFGVEFDFISPAEAGRIAPILRTDDLAGAVWIPGDGKANPTDLTQSLAKGARMSGATIAEGVKVTGVDVRDGRVRGVRWKAAERRRNDRLRGDRQLRRAVGPRVRSRRRRHGAALRRRALLSRHQGDCRRDLRSARHPRPGRIPLLQGGSGRTRDGRFRTEGQAVERGSDPRGIRIPAAGGGLGSFRDPDAQCDPSHAVPRDGGNQIAAERPGELHARRQFHPGRSPRGRGLFRLRGLQLRRHRELGRCRQAHRRVDRQRRGAARPLGRRHPPLRAVSRQSPSSRRPHRGDARASLRDALAPRGAGNRAPASAVSALRPARCEGRGLRLEDELGARELFSSAGRHAARVHARHAGLAAARAGGAARLPRGCRRIRPDVVRQVRPQGSRRARRAAAPLRQRDRRAGRQDGLHGHAERARRVRERSHGDPPRAVRILHRHRIRAAHARRRVDRAPHWRRSARRARRCDGRLLGHFDDGPESGGAARPAVARRSVESGDAVCGDAGNRRRPCARPRRADELRRRPGLRALRHRRPMRHALRCADRRRQRIRPARRRLLHDRCAAHRGGPPRLGRRAVPRRNAVGSRAWLCGENGQEATVHRPRRARSQDRRPPSRNGWCCCPSTNPRPFRGAASRC